jgi:hypothetical protein
MLTQLLKFGALIATGRFLKQRWRGLLWVFGAWIVLWFVHGEFVSYVELSDDRRYVLHASLIKLALYALTVAMYVWRVERKLWPRASAPAVAPSPAPNPAALQNPAPRRGDDGFDFLRIKPRDD